MKLDVCEEAMPRIPEVLSRDDLPPESRYAFDEIEASRGRVVGPFAVLLNSPELARRIADAGAYVRFESTISARVNELASLITAREFDCQYEWTAHQPQAEKVGIPVEVIAAIRERKPLQGLSAEDALVVDYSLEVLRNHRVSEATFDAALTTFGVQGLIDLTATIGYYSMLAAALNSFEVAPVGEPLLPV